MMMISFQSNLTKGHIVDLSPRVDSDGFVRSWTSSRTSDYISELTRVPWTHMSQLPNGILISAPVSAQLAWPPSNTWFFGLTWVSTLTCILIGSSIFVGLMNMTNRQTHRQTDKPHIPPVAIGIHLMHWVHAVRPNNSGNYTGCRVSGDTLQYGLEEIVYHRHTRQMAQLFTYLLSHNLFSSCIRWYLVSHACDWVMPALSAFLIFSVSNSVCYSSIYRSLGRTSTAAYCLF